jgi:DNA-binding NtrC family response regulator
MSGPAAPPLETVVFVDDEDAVLASVRRLLRGEPYDLLATTSVEEAIRWVSSRDVGVVVSDYRMPGVDGMELLERVREASPRTGRVLLTGYPGESVALRSLKQADLLLLSKPWDNAELIRVIRERLERRRAKVPRA